MSNVISSFGFNGVKGQEALTHATVNDIELIKESIPMSHEHFNLIRDAIKKSHDIGVDKTARLTKEALNGVLEFNKPYL